MAESSCLVEASGDRRGDQPVDPCWHELPAGAEVSINRGAAHNRAWARRARHTVEEPSIVLRGHREDLRVLRRENLLSLRGARVALSQRRHHPARAGQSEKEAQQGERQKCHHGAGLPLCRTCGRAPVPPAPAVRRVGVLHGLGGCDIRAALRWRGAGLQVLPTARVGLATTGETSDCLHLQPTRRAWRVAMSWPCSSWRGSRARWTRSLRTSAHSAPCSIRARICAA
jgi:hypothetical protein